MGEQDSPLYVQYSHYDVRVKTHVRRLVVSVFYPKIDVQLANKFATGHLADPLGICEA